MKSATHKASGRLAVKSRFTKSGARTWAESDLVVKRFFARVAPRMPSSRMRRATWSRPMSMAGRRAAFQSLRRP